MLHKTFVQSALTCVLIEAANVKSSYVFLWKTRKKLLEVSLWIRPCKVYQLCWRFKVSEFLKSAATCLSHNLEPEGTLKSPLDGYNREAESGHLLT